MSSGLQNAAQKVVLYGPGGIGKTKLASLLAELGIEPLIVDVETGSGHLNVQRIAGIETWQELRDVLHDESLSSQFGAIVVDSFTKAEELGIRHTLATVPTESGKYVESIEGYGYGKGFTHNYETFLHLLGDLDAIQRRGKHVIAICHDCTANVPNPYGEDWMRYEPRLQNSPKASIRHRVREWCDHLLYIGYDVAVNKDGKGVGGGTRTIYPAELPTHMAKSRCLADTIAYQDGNPELWKKLFNKGE